MGSISEMEADFAAISRGYQMEISKKIWQDIHRGVQMGMAESYFQDKGYSMSHSMPKLVCALTHNFDAWIVGSAAKPDNTNPRDYDVVVPFSQWGPASQLIPPDAKPNTFGGWKCISEGVEVDVWPGELGWLMTKPKAKYVWHPASDTRYVKTSSVYRTSRPINKDDMVVEID